MVRGGEKQCRGRSLSREWHRTNHELTSILLVPQSDAKPFRNITITQQDQLLADITAAAIAQEHAVTGGTHNGKARAW